MGLRNDRYGVPETKKQKESFCRRVFVESYRLFVARSGFRIHARIVRLLSLCVLHLLSFHHHNKRRKSGDNTTQQILYSNTGLLGNHGNGN